MKKPKKIAGWLLAFVLALSVLAPGMTALAADYTINEGGTHDLNEYGNGSKITISTTEPVTLTNTSGMVYTDVEIYCLQSGVTLTLDGIKIQNSTDRLCALSFNGTGNTLILAGTSALTSGTYEPGIRVEDGDALTIKGTGAIEVQSGTYSAGIGSSMYNDCGSVTIESGTVHAIGGSFGAGIGGGENGAGGDITIKGGDVTAESGYSGSAAIGTGSEGDGGTIVIEDGTVHATTSYSSGAGIGSGYSGTTESITISGGTITAVGGDGGAGIGSGNQGAPVDITISGGDITASGGGYGAGIGGGNFVSGGTIHIKDCKITATGGESGAGIGGGQGGFGGGNGGNITIENSNVTANGGNFAAGIGGGESGSGETILIDGGTVKAKGGTNSDGFNGAGIGGGRYGTGGTITIQSGDVTATGGKSGAGIGSGDNYYTDVDLSGGVITINGGTVTAKGGGYGAGIGGGDSSTSGTIVINSGKVIATGGSSGAGIGGGNSANCDFVTIKGGTVTATGGSSGSGIGGGSKGAGGTVTLESGTIVATGGTSGSGIGGGAGTGGTASTIKILAAANVKAVASGTTRPAIFAAGNALDGQSTANVMMANFSAQKNANTATQIYAAGDMSLAAELTPAAKYQSIAFTAASGTYRVKAGGTLQQYGISPNINTSFVVSSGLTIFGSVANATNYNISVAAATGGSVTADVAKAAKGDTVKLTITPYTGWQLQSLVYNDGTNHSIMGSSFVMPAANVTVTAVFEEISDVSVIWLSAMADGLEDSSDSTKIDLTFNTSIVGLTAGDIGITNGTGQADKGTLSGSGTNWTIALTSVVKQGEISVTVASPEGYIISGSPKSVAVYKAVVPTGTAPTITTSALDDGAVGTAYSGILLASGDTPITWSIKSGSLPDGLSLSGNTICGTPEAEGTFNFTVKAENSTGSDTKALSIYIGSVAPATYAITATAGTGGSISPSGSVSVAAGGSQTFTITPSSNYSIASVTVDGVAQEAVSSYTFTGVSGTHTIHAAFAYTRGNDDAGYSTRTLTDNATDISLSGKLSESARLTVGGMTLGTSDADKTIQLWLGDSDQVLLLGVDITLSGGFTGHLTISLPVGIQYNGETVTILHAKRDGTLETLTAVVQDGKVTFAVTSLSPFAVFIMDGLDDIPKTGENSSLWIWWLLCGVSAAGTGLLTVLLALGRRRKLHRR